MPRADETLVGLPTSDDTVVAGNDTAAEVARLQAVPTLDSNQYLQLAIAGQRREADHLVREQRRAPNPDTVDKLATTVARVGLEESNTHFAKFMGRSYQRYQQVKGRHTVPASPHDAANEREMDAQLTRVTGALGRRASITDVQSLALRAYPAGGGAGDAEAIRRLPDVVTEFCRQSGTNVAGVAGTPGWVNNVFTLLGNQRRDATRQYHAELTYSAEGLADLELLYRRFYETAPGSPQRRTVVGELRTWSRTTSARLNGPDAALVGRHDPSAMDRFQAMMDLDGLLARTDIETTASPDVVREYFGRLPLRRPLPVTMVTDRLDRAAETLRASNEINADARLRLAEDIHASIMDMLRTSVTMIEEKYGREAYRTAFRGEVALHADEVSGKEMGLVTYNTIDSRARMRTLMAGVQSLEGGPGAPGLGQEFREDVTFTLIRAARGLIGRLEQIVAWSDTQQTGLPATVAALMRQYGESIAPLRQKLQAMETIVNSPRMEATVLLPALANQTVEQRETTRRRAAAMGPINPALLATMIRSDDPNNRILARLWVSGQVKEGIDSFGTDQERVLTTIARSGTQMRTAAEETRQAGENLKAAVWRIVMIGAGIVIGAIVLKDLIKAAARRMVFGRPASPSDIRKAQEATMAEFEKLRGEITVQNEQIVEMRTTLLGELPPEGAEGAAEVRAPILEQLARLNTNLEQNNRRLRAIEQALVAAGTLNPADLADTPTDPPPPVDGAEKKS